MINDFSEKLIKELISRGLLDEALYTEVDFYFRTFLFNTIIILVLFAINVSINTYKEMIIISIVFNIMRLFIDDTFHCNTLEKCIIITTTYISLCSYITYLLLPYYIICAIISSICVIYFYNKYKINKIGIENQKIFFNIILILIVIMIIGILLHLKILISSISCAIFSVLWITSDIGQAFFNKIQHYL